MGADARLLVPLAALKADEGPADTGHRNAQNKLQILPQGKLTVQILRQQHSVTPPSSFLPRIIS